MKQTILSANSLTGWTGSTGVTFSLVETEYLSNNLLASVGIHFPVTAESYAEYTFPTPISVGAFTDLVFHAVSKNKGRSIFRSTTDFAYRIEFQSSTDGYLLPITSGWHDITVRLGGVTAIHKIRIVSLTGVDDITVSSFMLAVQEIPLDILVGIKDQIEFHRGKLAKTLIGSTTVATGDTSVTFSADVPYIDKYVCIELVDGTSKSEIHQIGDKNGLHITFSDLLDGLSITACSGLCSVYLYVPVEYGKTQKEILLPSISVWSMEPTEKGISTGVAKVIDQWAEDGSVLERTEGIYQDYDILIDCESRQTEILALLAYIVRRTIGHRIVWINGRMSYLTFYGNAKEILPTESFNVIPKIEYTCHVEVKEDIFDPVHLVKTTAVEVVPSII